MVILFFIWTACPVKLCPALRDRPASFAFSPNRTPIAPRMARQKLAEKTGEFSPEKSRDKMPRRAFYPAFQGSAFRLHCLTATASRPFQSGVGCLARKIPRTPSSRIKVFLCFSIKLDAFSFLAYNLIYQRELWKKVFTESCLLTRIALRCKIRNSQFAIRNSQFAIRNSQFAIRNSQFAHKFSLYKF